MTVTPRTTSEEPTVQQGVPTTTEPVMTITAISKMKKEEILQELTDRGVDYPSRITKLEAQALLKATRNVQDPTASSNVLKGIGEKKRA